MTSLPGRSAARRAVGAAALMAALAPLMGSAWSAAHQQPATLTVFAAASLTGAFTALGHIFEVAHPGTKVRFAFAGSQQLALQLEQGAGAGVFASADQRSMAYASTHGLLAGRPREFARNRLVVVVPAENAAGVERLQDLARHGIKLVIAAPAVPAGAYTRQLLRTLAATPGFGRAYDRAVLANVVSEEENVKAVLAKVQLGEADAGIVYRSDVSPAVAQQVRSIEVPDAMNVVASYPIAVLKGGDSELARTFVALAMSETGQAIIERSGLIRAGGAR